MQYTLHIYLTFFCLVMSTDQNLQLISSLGIIPSAMKFTIIKKKNLSEVVLY